MAVAAAIGAGGSDYEEGFSQAKSLNNRIKKMGSLQFNKSQSNQV